MGVGGWELGWVVVWHRSLGPFHNTIPNSNTNEGGVRDTKSIPIVIFLIWYIKSILGVGGLGWGWVVMWHESLGPGLMNFYKKVKSKFFCLPSFKFQYKQKCQFVWRWRLRRSLWKRCHHWLSQKSLLSSWKLVFKNVQCVWSEP